MEITTYYVLIIGMSIIFYSYIGYGIVLYVLVLLKRQIKGKKTYYPLEYYSEVTLFITAYNETDIIEQKIQNSNKLNYPADKLHQVWVTDGSTDGSPQKLKRYPNISLYHKDIRKGKIAAMNRGMQFIKTPIVVFSDANTILATESIKEIVYLFQDEKIGCVAGEKRIISNEIDGASGAGEGIYWKYESHLKKWDSELYSVVGAAGELFAIRSKLFTKVESNVLLDDFIISLRLAMNKHRTGYSPNAYAIESPSANIKEELKRKIRIAAGGIQSIIMLRPLLNIFRYGILSFQYISHRVLRWTLAPLFLPIVFVSNIYLVLVAPTLLLQVLLLMQILFYMAALVGWRLEKKQIRLKPLFVPYYFSMMNYAIYAGFIKYIRGKQKVTWEKAKRA